MKPFTWALLSVLLSYWLFATVLAPFPYRLDKSLWRTYDSLSRFDPATVLAQRFPNVAEQDRKHIGQVPQNLDHLIRGADASGTLRLPAPDPGHALLLTVNVPTGKIIYGPHLLGPDVDLHITNANDRTVRGVGVVTDRDGTVHYFRTVPFNPPPASETPPTRIETPSSLNYIPPRSTEKSSIFPPRRITLSLPNGDTFHSHKRIFLSHVSTRPLASVAVPEGEVTVYPPRLLEELLAGPHPVPMEQEHGRGQRLVRWSDRPNWSKKDLNSGTRRGSVAALTNATPAPSPKWYQKLTKPFSRSKSGGSASSLMRSDAQDASSSALSLQHHRGH